MPGQPLPESKAHLPWHRKDLRATAGPSAGLERGSPSSTLDLGLVTLWPVNGRAPARTQHCDRRAREPHFLARERQECQLPGQMVPDSLRFTISLRPGGQGAFTHLLLNGNEAGQLWLS